MLRRGLSGVLLYFHKALPANFGDELNPWLWTKVFPGQFSGELYHDPRLRGTFDADATLFIGIGTLLNKHVPSRNPKVVFGSGAGYGDLPRIDETWRFMFVRGPWTAQRLGLPASKVIVDPAILAADYCAAVDASIVRSPAYMSHCASVENADWAELCEDLGLRFIDPRWPVERVLYELGRTSTLFTEALHGAILAEAFRIPWVPMKSSPAILDVKWEDWCRSIGLDYKPESLPALWKPPGTAVGRLRFTVKKNLVRMELKKILRSHRARRSDDRTFEIVRSRLLEQIEMFKSEKSRY
jgi:succinoglycan biosynthesis protein ExoV